MWNSFNTGDYSGMIAETRKIKGFNDDEITVYYSRPLTNGKYPSLLLIPHMPGWDEYTRELARRFTEHGYSVVCPDLNSRFGTGTPVEMSRKARENGGNSDRQVMGDCQKAIDFLKQQPTASGKVGVIGMCSGGRHTFLAACTLEGVDAAADLWGGRVIAAPEDLSENSPVAPVDYAENLSCPLIGIFGNDDKHPSPEEVDALEQRLIQLGKEYEFHRYDGAGHAFWCYDRDPYRIEQAMDSFNKVLSFFDRNLK